MGEGEMNLLDLFSGIGGFSLGLQQAGFKFEHHYYSDIDKYANQIYKKQFPEAKELGDVRTINVGDLPDGEWIITFGFPCQDVSIAGKRQGFKGERTSLFFEAVRIIRDLRPKIFIFENVKGLFSANNGRDFETILRTIADIGLYECEWQLLNTKWFLPQNRERIYFIGHLAGQSTPKVFPISESNCHNAKSGKQSKDRVWAVGIDANYNKGADGKRTMLICDSGVHRKPEKREILPPLRANTGAGHNDFLKTPSSIRRLTPIECERLQGFPDNWTEGISDTQRYKCLGNAVTVNVVEEIGRRLLN